jgi:hypothetical protein
MGPKSRVQGDNRADIGLDVGMSHAMSKAWLIDEEFAGIGFQIAIKDAEDKAAAADIANGEAILVFCPRPGAIRAPAGKMPDFQVVHLIKQGY